MREAGERHRTKKVTAHNSRRAPITSPGESTPTFLLALISSRRSQLTRLPNAVFHLAVRLLHPPSTQNTGLLVVTFLSKLGL